MASTYERKDSPFIWIRFRDANGKWKSFSSGYRKSNSSDRLSAKRMAQKQSLKEATSKAFTKSGSAWSDWVLAWMNSRWGDTTTAKLYLRHLQQWLAFFDEKQIKSPVQVRREHVDEFLIWRKKHGGARNTAIQEVKFLAQMMDEAIARGFIATNPARKLKLKPEASKEKSVWTDAEVELVNAALEKKDKFGWMHVTFLMGLNQAVRLRQSAVPLSAIDFTRKLINYPDVIVKGAKGYSQPISPAFIETLRDIVEHRQKLKRSTLADIPDGITARPASIQWRTLLDALGLPHLCHHGLRATWITQAALRGIPESLAMRFTNHASAQVHAIYMKITATDLMPMLDAFLLAKPNALALSPK
jgi:site-specific recombinase XerD